MCVVHVSCGCSARSWSLCYLCRHVVTRGQAPATIHDKRVMFRKGTFDVVLAPLNAFQGGQSWADVFCQGWGNQIQSVSSMSANKRKAESTMQTWARGGPIRPVPHPTNARGQKLCHGAILHFDKRPPHLHSAVALRRWLKSRNVTMSTTRRHTYLGK